jgi:hypothetical protein
MRKNDMESLKRHRPRWRRVLLTAVYDEVGASVTDFVDVLALGDTLGVPADEVRKALGYFEEKGWLRVDDHRGGVARLTAAGADVVESWAEAE